MYVALVQSALKTYLHKHGILKERNRFSDIFNLNVISHG